MVSISNPLKMRNLDMGAHIEIDECDTPAPVTLTDYAKSIKESLFNDRDPEGVFSNLHDDVVWEIATYPGMRAVGRKEVQSALKKWFDWIEEGRFEFVDSTEERDRRQVWMQFNQHFQAEGKWFSVPVCDVMTFDANMKLLEWKEFHTLDYLKDIDVSPYDEKQPAGSNV